MDKNPRMLQSKPNQLKQDILKKILFKKLLLLISFIFLSCARNPYLTSYEPIHTYLAIQKIDKHKKYILQSDKEPNKTPLRLFNGGEGLGHIIDSTDSTDYTNGLFVNKHWEEMYKQYAHDNIKRYWNKEDFSNYNFILEKGTGLSMKRDFLIKYPPESRIDEIIIISDLIYYMNRKYVMFSFSKRFFTGSGSTSLIIMTKEKNKWILVKVIGDYIYS